MMVMGQSLLANQITVKDSREALGILQNDAVGNVNDYEEGSINYEKLCKIIPASKFLIAKKDTTYMQKIAPAVKEKTHVLVNEISDVGGFLGIVRNLTQTWHPDAKDDFSYLNRAFMDNALTAVLDPQFQKYFTPPSFLTQWFSEHYHVVLKKLNKEKLLHAIDDLTQSLNGFRNGDINADVDFEYLQEFNFGYTQFTGSGGSPTEKLSDMNQDILGAMNNRNIKKRDDIEKLRKEIADKGAIIKGQAANIELLQKIIAGSKAAIAKTKEKVKQLRKQANIDKKNIAKLKDVIVKRDKNIDILYTAAKNLNEDNKKLAGQLEDQKNTFTAALKESESIIKGFEDQKKQFVEQVKKLGINATSENVFKQILIFYSDQGRDLQKLRGDVAELTRKAALSKAFQKELLEKQASFDEQKEKIKTMEKVMVSLKNLISERDEKITQLTQKSDNQQKAIEEQKQTIETLTETNEKYMKDASELKLNFAQKVSEINQLQSIVEKNKKKNQELIDDMAQYETEIAGLKLDKENLKVSLEKAEVMSKVLGEELDDTYGQLDQTDKENESLRTALAQITKDFENFKTNGAPEAINVLKQELVTVKGLLEKEQVKNTQQLAAIEEQKKESDKLKDFYEQSMKDVQKTFEQQMADFEKNRNAYITSLELRLENSDESLRLSQAELVSSGIRYKEKIAEGEQKQTELVATTKETLVENKQQKEEIARLVDRLDMAQKSLREANENHLKEIEFLRTESKKMIDVKVSQVTSNFKEKENDLNSQLAELKKQSDLAKKSYDDSVQSYKNEIQEIQKQQALVNQQKNAIEEQLKKLESEKTKNDELQSQFNQLQNVNQSLVQEQKVVESRLGECQKKNAELEKYMENYELEFRKQNETIMQQKVQLGELSVKLEKANSTVQDLSEKLVEAQKKNNEDLAAFGNAIEEVRDVNKKEIDKLAKANQQQTEQLKQASDNIDQLAREKAEEILINAAEGLKEKFVEKDTFNELTKELEKALAEKINLEKQVKQLQRSLTMQSSHVSLSEFLDESVGYFDLPNPKKANQAGSVDIKK